MTLKQLKFFFKLKILFFVCKLLCQEKKFFFCVQKTIYCVQKQYSPIITSHAYIHSTALKKIKFFIFSSLNFWGSQLPTLDPIRISHNNYWRVKPTNINYKIQRWTFSSRTGIKKVKIFDFFMIFWGLITQKSSSY